MGKSATEFVKAVARKWGWLVTGVVGGGTFVLNLLGIDPTMSKVIGIAILGVCLLFACFLVYHDMRMDLMRSVPAPTEKPLTLTLPKKYLLSDHNIAIWDVSEAMRKKHGHSDDDGLRADVKDGVLVTDLLSRNCTRCGIPRNQRGDFVL